MTQVPTADVETPLTPTTNYIDQPIPTSPPPSFRSQASSPTLLRHSPRDDVSSVDQTLADTFDDGQASDDDADNVGDDRQRLMQGTRVSQENQSVSATAVVLSQVSAEQDGNSNPRVNPAVSTPTQSSATSYTAFSSSNDGVFANLNAKPERGEKNEDQPPVCSR